MKIVKAVTVYIFRKCARCGKEEDPETITRKLENTVSVPEDARVTVEILYDNEAPQ
jgi:hypothetical protein